MARDRAFERERIGNAISGRLDYNNSPRAWPPQDLQINFGKLARKAAQSTSKTIQRLRGRKNSEVAKPAPTSAVVAAPVLRRKLTMLDGVEEPQGAATARTDQSRSRLFQLPLELRQEIYKQVLGYSNIHIKPIMGGKRYRHLRCKCRTCPGFAHALETRNWRNEWACDDSKYTVDGDTLHLGLLRTCQQVYSEAIGLVYSSNIFSFKDPLHFQKFVASLLPQRSAQIRTVHIDMQIPRAQHGGEVSQELSNTASDTLASLPNLMNVELRLHSTPGSSHKELLASFRRLKGMETLQNFRFYIVESNWKEGWMGETPFEVVPMDQWEWKLVHRAQKELQVF